MSVFAFFRTKIVNLEIIENIFVISFLFFVILETIAFLCFMNSSFDEFFTSRHLTSYSGLGVGIATLNSSLFLDDKSIPIAAHTFILVREGALTINVCGKDFCMVKGDVSDVVASDNLQIMSMVQCTDAVGLFFSESYLQSVFKFHPPLSITYVDFIRKNKVFRFGEKSIQSLSSLLSSFADTLKFPSNSHFQLLLQLKFQIFFLEMDNAFKSFIMDNRADDSYSSRIQFLFSQFVKLLTQNVRQQHGVNFYATQLCISPQYLGQIVRSMADKTVFFFISNAVIGEVNLLLANSSLPLKQVALEMNFSDQATFTKYYKRHTGLTPLAYRNSLFNK